MRIITAILYHSVLSYHGISCLCEEQEHPHLNQLTEDVALEVEATCTNASAYTVCQDSPEPEPQCQLYMAESSIPNSGFGVYTATPIKSGESFHGGAEDNAFEFIDEKLNLFRGALISLEDSKRLFGAVAGKSDNDTYCLIWARDGECELNEEFMLETCARSCALKQAGFGRDHAMILEKDKESSCKEWAEEGECESNEIFMIQTCPLSCIAEKYQADFKTAEKNLLISDYFWDGKTSRSRFEADDVATIIPGIGSLVNSHFGLKNVDLKALKIDSEGYHRASHVESGAFADRRVGFRADDYIPAGMELFVDYGYSYFTGDRKDKYGPIPMSHHYSEADQMLEDFWREIDSHGTESDEATQLYDNIMDSIEEPEIKMLMPDTYEKANEVRGISSARLSVPNVIRSPEWLQNNGICLDNIRPGQSTIAQAGRGAFATKNINEGQVIAPMPLIQMDKRALRKFQGDREVNEQIMLNYSFGHPKSSLLLFPYSPFVNLVNNNADKSKVNAKLRWSSKFHKKSWEGNTVDEVIAKGRAGLALELVATTDIRQDDEIFINYGSEWDTAWEKHVKTWEAPPSSEDYMSVDLLNNEKVIKTLQEQESEPYGYNVMTACWLRINDFLNDIKKNEGKVVDLKWADYSVSLDLKDEFEISFHTTKCHVVDRTDIGDNLVEYRVFVEGMAKKKGPDGSEQKEEKMKVFFNGVPRDGIEFFDKKYTSDLYLQSAFRHPIYIPDEIFPVRWMDLIEG